MQFQLNRTGPGREQQTEKAEVKNLENTTKRLDMASPNKLYSPVVSLLSVKNTKLSIYDQSLSQCSSWIELLTYVTSMSHHCEVDRRSYGDCFFTNLRENSRVIQIFFEQKLIKCH